MKMKRAICIVTAVLMAMIVPAGFSFGEELGDGGTITGFAETQMGTYYFEGQPTEAEMTKYMPQTIDVYLDGGKKKTALEVGWSVVEDYEDSDYYLYSLKPVWTDAYQLSKDLDPMGDVPWITVYRQFSKAEQKKGVQEPEIPVSHPKRVKPVYTEDDGPVNPAKAGNAVTAQVLEALTEESWAASNEGTTYKYLTKTMGLNKAAACGVMTNLYAESGILPNNLENRYNRKYGLSDSEYTKRVNAGIKDNGKYKTKSGQTRYFTKDYCGYGIAQWTSLGRRAKLLKRALKEDVSIGNLNMQLGFLQSELKRGYPQVWATLQGVPNNAAGAYLAAAEFCVSFEVPANTFYTAASRGRNTLSSYWEVYGGKKAAESGTSYLGLCGYSYPEGLKKGKGMTCSGHVISNYKVKQVTCKIKKKDGKTVCSKTKKPGCSVYSIYNFDNAMTFEKLSAGEYIYQITAKDASGKIVSVKHAFKVAKNGKTKIVRGCAVADRQEQADSAKKQGLRGSGITYPKSLKKGKSFDIKGKVMSDYGLKKVTIGVYTDDNKAKQTASAKLSGEVIYNLKKLDDDIKFGKLKKGTYKYVVKASDKKTSKTLLNKKFTVK